MSQFIGLFKFELSFQNISIRIEIDFKMLAMQTLPEVCSQYPKVIFYTLPVFRFTHFEMLFVLFLDDGMVGEYEQPQYAEQPSEG